MVSKLRYIHFVYFLIGFQLVCYDEYECTNSSVISSADTINTIVTTAASLPMEARKLLSDDENESISTSDSNSLSDSSELLTNEQQITKHESQYYNEPTTTIGYEQPSYTNYNHHSPVHHHVIALHMAKPMNQTYFTAPLLTTPYTSTNSFLPSGNHLRIVKITNSQPWSSSPSPALSSLSPQLRLPLALPPLLSPPSHELTYLGNQYIASFRNIKSSVMNIIYKLQDFMSYVMNFFTMGKLEWYIKWYDTTCIATSCRGIYINFSFDFQLINKMIRMNVKTSCVCVCVCIETFAVICPINSDVHDSCATMAHFELRVRHDTKPPK